MTTYQTKDQGDDGRPLLATVSGHYTPYKVHIQRRIVAELTQVRLASLVTKRRSGPWANPDLPEIHTVFMDAGPLEPAQGAAWLRNELRTARRTWAWLEANRPAAVLVSGYDELPAVVASNWARMRRRALLIAADSNVHGDRATGLKRVVKSLYVPWAVRKPAKLLVVGELGKAFFRRYGVSEDHFSLFPLEPDYGLIQTFPSEEAAATGARLGLDPARRRLLCCNRLAVEKRVELVIDAFAAIAEERASWDLVIAGDGPLRAMLEEGTSQSLLKTGRVRFLGFQDQRAVTALYRCCDALVLASDHDAWALVINEAACAGLAIVTTNVVGAARELVRDGVNGLIVPPANGPALRAAMERITAPGVAGAMGAASVHELERWRREADPVQGLREALARTGVISPPTRDGATGPGESVTSC